MLHIIVWWILICSGPVTIARADPEFTKDLLLWFSDNTCMSSGHRKQCLETCIAPFVSSCRQKNQPSKCILLLYFKKKTCVLNMFIA